MKNLIKEIVFELRGKTSKEVFESLVERSELKREVKNLIYFYLFPRPLLHMEFPNRLKESRDSRGNTLGYLEEDIEETALLLEAFKTEQYSRYIKHLLYSYKDISCVGPASGDKECECGICKKKIFEFSKWEQICKEYNNLEELEKRQHLCFCSTDSRMRLCTNCLIQLKSLESILDEIEPDWDRRGKFIND